MYKRHCRQIAGNKSSLLLFPRQKVHSPLSVAQDVHVSSLAGTIKDGYVLIAGGTLRCLLFNLVRRSLVSCQSFTDQGEAVGGRAEGLAQEEVPVEEEAGSRMGTHRAEGSAGALVGQVCAGWSEEEPGWEVACKGEE